MILESRAYSRLSCRSGIKVFLLHMAGLLREWGQRHLYDHGSTVGLGLWG